MMVLNTSTSRKTLQQTETPFTQFFFHQFQMAAYTGPGILTVLSLPEHPDCAIKSQPLVTQPTTPSHGCKIQRLNHVPAHMVSQRNHRWFCCWSAHNQTGPLTGGGISHKYKELLLTSPGPPLLRKWSLHLQADPEVFCQLPGVSQ